MAHHKRIPKYHGKLPRLTTEQMIEVDRLMIEKYQIELLQMMENAGRALAVLARSRFLSGKNKKHRMVVLAGTGGNGGGALVCARRLWNWGFNVEVYVTKPRKMTPVPGHQLTILRKMKIPIHSYKELSQKEHPGLIVDGLIGYSLSGNPSGPAQEMIQWTNAQKAKVLSLDTPSGIDLSTGTIHNPVVKANATLTLALPKVGLYQKAVKKLRGDLYLADISVPPALYAEPSIGIPVKCIFQQGDLLRLK